MSTRSFTAPIKYFFEEGKPNLHECFDIAFHAALVHDIRTLVVFTSAGEGVRIALDEYLTNPDYAGMKVIAVTFPVGKTPEPTMPTDLIRSFEERGVPVVRANLPLDPMDGTFHERGLGQGHSLLGSVLEVFGGSMSLCVQAVLMACDAGAIEMGDHVISMTSDTAILAQASPTRYFLSGFVVREILCKPVLLTIGRKEIQEGPVTGEAVGASHEPQQLEGSVQPAQRPTSEQPQ
jgi:hypothetical protein